MDDHGHGTHCAGTISGNGASGSQTGIAPGSYIMALRVINNQGIAIESNCWNAIQFAVEHGADIISMSFGWQHAWNPDRAGWRTVLDNTLAKPPDALTNFPPSPGEFSILNIKVPSGMFFNASAFPF